MIYDINGQSLNNAYGIDGDSLSLAYDNDGDVIWSRSSHPVSNSFTRSLLFAPEDVPTGIQGLACDNLTQTIAQLYTGKIYTITVPDGNVSFVANINLGHGNTGQFYPTKSDDQDYPLLYVSGEKYFVDNTQYLYLMLVQCTFNSATLQKIYAIPIIDSIASTVQVVVDFENNIAYHIGASTYYGETDYTYITAWDLTQSEPLQGATHNPMPQNGIDVFTHKIDTFQIPFVHEMQAATFFDGMIVMLSDKSNAVDKRVFFLDVKTKSIYLTIDHDMPAGELEGIGFLYNSTTQQNDMIVSVRHGDREYYRYEFNL